MLSIETILGQDLRFWGTVIVASILKLLFTPDNETRTPKQAVAGIVAGCVCAFYGSDYIMTKFEIAVSDRDIVLIGLVITGEHIVRTLFTFGPMLARKFFGISEDEAAKFNKGDDNASK